MLSWCHWQKHSECNASGTRRDALAVCFPKSELQRQALYTYPSCCNGYNHDYKVCEVRSTIEGAYDYFANTNIQWPFAPDSVTMTLNIPT